MASSTVSSPNGISHTRFANPLAQLLRSQAERVTDFGKSLLLLMKVSSNGWPSGGCGPN
jgi:hypothetical protein